MFTGGKVVEGLHGVVPEGDADTVSYVGEKGGNEVDPVGASLGEVGSKSLRTMSMSTELSISQTTDGSGSGCVKGSEVWREEGRQKSDRRLGCGGRAEPWHQGPTPAGSPAAPTLPQSRVSLPHAQKKEGKVKKNRMGELRPVRLSKG